MAKKGKKYLESAAKLDRQKIYPLEEGVGLALQCKFAKFDETVDVAIRLGVDPRHADQMVRSSVVLPNGTGKTERVLVFAKGDKEKEALDAGADYAGSDEYIEKIQGGWLEFDKTIATPDMMGAVGKIGKILGPRGLMPNPKVGTVTFDVGKAVRDLKGGKVEFKVDKTGTLHAGIGKISFGTDRIRENFLAFFEAIMKAKPSAAKGTYIRSIALSSTMGVGIKLNASALQLE